MGVVADTFLNKEKWVGTSRACVFVEAFVSACMYFTCYISGNLSPFFLRIFHTWPVSYPLCPQRAPVFALKKKRNVVIGWLVWFVRSLKLPLNLFRLANSKVCCWLSRLNLIIIDDFSSTNTSLGVFLDRWAHQHLRSKRKSNCTKSQQHNAMGVLM